ncbi:MAG: hypothetical protein LBQ87_08135 [Candidatus Fibromonas sp.]|jgi:hypothetical protein|nr:hypothetical protein [Candidatus Fibromonas sp.]
MKKILLGILFFAVFASSAVTQKSITGNWTLVPSRAQNPNAIITLEKDTLKITDDWKFAETGIYNINYPGYGANKINLKYKLKVNIAGDYRIESNALRKYQNVFEREILEGTASDADAAQASLKEIEKLIRDDLRVAAPVLSTSETEMELQGVNNNPNLKYTKPKKLPVSKLTMDTVPFFPPEGWRYPESAKELANFPVRLKNSKNLLTVVKADFNGDGLIDAAAYLMNSEREQVALFMNISQSDGSYELKPYGNADKGTVIENGIMFASAGEHTDIITKSKVMIENPGIMEIVFDTTAYLIYWDSNSKEWVKITLGKRL